MSAARAAIWASSSNGNGSSGDSVVHSDNGDDVSPVPKWDFLCTVGSTAMRIDGKHTATTGIFSTATYAESGLCHVMREG